MNQNNWLKGRDLIKVILRDKNTLFPDKNINAT